jgi:aminopeptidase N
VADAFRAILLDEKIDPALAAEILTLPSATEIAELFDIIDPIAIVAVREALTRTLAAELADEFLAIYNANKLDAYRVEHADIGKRSLQYLPALSGVWRNRAGEHPGEQAVSRSG